MEFAKVLGIVLLIVLILLTIFFIVGVSLPEGEFGITTTTTTSATNPTTTTTPEATGASNFSAANLSSDNVTDENVAWLEQRTFELVNEERTTRGLGELEWNEEVADVCRAHSEDMGVHGFFSHTGSDGSNVSVRLREAEIYYWNLSGENILMESGIDYYSLNLLGRVKKVGYKTFEELAVEAVEGWMNSTGHRENILAAGFDEAGMGVYVLQGTLLESSYANVSYYFTQDFITRIDCGYKDGSCCTEVGYLPWCYVPWKCELGVCE